MHEFTLEELADFAAIPDPNEAGLLRGEEVTEDPKPEEPTNGDR